MSKRAYTLVELLVAIAVMGLLSVGLMGFLGNFLNLKIRAEAKLRIREEGNYALDRIEYLIRNSITLPDICMSGTSTLEDVCKTSGGGICTNGAYGSAATTIKLNLRGENRTTDYIHRMRVFYTSTSASSTSPAYGDIVEVSTYPSCSGSTQCKHNETPSGGWVKTHGYSLTRAGSGSVGALTNSFNVSSFSAQCFYDKAFSNGYIVRVKFAIEYQRKSLNAHEETLREEFARDVAIRNTGNFQN